MEWALEPRIVFAFATGAIVLIAASLLIVGWRKRTASCGTNQLRNIVSSYPGLDPGLVRIMKSLLETGLVDELTRQKDVQKAIQSLSTRFGELHKKGRQRTPGSVLAVPLEIEPSAGRNVDPALVTILRAAYFSPKVSEQLPVETVRELDQLLDSLTG
ncbi:MAG TPA: hypothetical protein VMY18_02080 [Acidobacteriota bacterium]|nr:hypothetical protein [Acidobacteriota bacterium]